MIITLNDSLSPPPPIQPVNVHNFISKIENSLPDKKKYIPVKVMQGHADFLRYGYLGHLSTAYSRHYSMEVAPHDIWYLILTQIVDQIKATPEKCKSLFTSSDEKVLIAIPQDHAVDINLEVLCNELLKLVPMDTTQFFPELSTHTPESKLACMAAFADGMQQYYLYGMFCCGIPKIHLTGTVEDWHNMLVCAKAMSKTFASCNMPQVSLYLARVNNILVDIRDTLAIPHDFAHTEFWQNIFTQKNVGSGGDLIIDGWIKDLFFDNTKGKMLKSFHNTLSAFPYTNLSTGEKFMMVHGGFKGVVLPGDILQCRYSHITFKDITA